MHSVSLYIITLYTHTLGNLILNIITTLWKHKEHLEEGSEHEQKHYNKTNLLPNPCITIIRQIVNLSFGSDRNRSRLSRLIISITEIGIISFHKDDKTKNIRAISGNYGIIHTRGK